jgi:CheY-like chemotaxis protein
MILLDIHLPGIDGWKVCEQIRKVKELQNTWIVVMTGDRNEDLQSKVQQYQANDLWFKPFDLIAVQKQIQDWLRVKKEGVYGKH